MNQAYLPPPDDMPPIDPDELLAPHNQDAEEGVLGSILVNNYALIEVDLKADDFFFLRNVKIWESIQRLAKRNEAIDNISLIDDLRNHGDLDNVGGGSYITYLMTGTATSLNVAIYAAIVARCATRRRLLRAAGNISDLAQRSDLDINEVVQKSEAELFRATDTGNKNDDLIPIVEIISDDYDRLQFIVDGGKITGLHTGFTALDDFLGGFQDEHLIVAAGRPGMGKSSLQAGIAANVARAGGKVGIISAEMSKREFMQRIISQESGINIQLLNSGKLTKAEWQLYQKHAAIVSQWGIAIDDTNEITTAQILKKALRMQHYYGLDLLVIDHLGRLGKPHGIEDEFEALSHNVQKSKTIARAIKRPVLLASQLNREVDKRVDKRPKLTDLRGTGRIEEEADLVIFLYRDEYYNPQTSEKNRVELHVAKNRHGATTGDHPIMLGFSPTCAKFLNTEFQEIDLTTYKPNN